MISPFKGVVLAASLWTAVGMIATVGAEEQTPWFHRHLVGIEVGPTGAQNGHSDPADTRYCSKFDGAQIVHHCVAANCEYLVLWVRDGDYAYYNSKLLPKAPGLAGRDPLRDAIEEAKKHRLPVIAYCVVQQAGHYLDAHPEFEMRGADGQRIGRFCLNSGYLEVMKQIVAEQLAYGLDGFHIDMLDQGFGRPYGCWCDTCRGLFEKQFGHAMPAGATWDQAWDDLLEFRYQASQRFEKELAAHIKRLDPRTTVDFNYHGSPPFSFEVGQRPVQHAGNSDFVTGETGVWGFGALTVGLNAEFYRASTPGLPYQVAIQRGVRIYHDQTTRPLADMRWELLTLLAHGAQVTMVDKTGFDGALDPAAYDRIGEAYAEARSKRAYFRQQPIQDVGLYYSSRSRDWMGRDKPLEWMQSFFGAHKACAYEHIPWGVILDENATLETLRRFAVVLLPNVGIVSEKELALLGQYVRAGGKLIITGQTGLFDRQGQPLADSTLGDLVGAKVTGRLESLDNWVRFPQGGTNPLAAGLKENWPLLVQGPATVYQVTTARAIGELLKPYRTTRQLEGKEGTYSPMSADAVVGPAVLLNQVGQGSVLTFAGSPDFATASEHHLVETRKLLAKAIRLLDPEPRVTIQAPANVEAIVTEDTASRTILVHLLGYLTPPQTIPVRNRPYVLPTPLEDLPMFRVAVAVKGPLKTAKALNPSTTVSLRGGRVEATINDIHEVLSLGY